jgi:RHS repeat-associated protein
LPNPCNDDVSNMVKKVDNNLKNKYSGGIIYTYEYGRVKKIDYPNKTDVAYIYGSATAGSNSAGRLLSVTDESGTVSFGYGKLGEQTSVTKVMNRLSPSAADITVTTSYQFDYLGRMESITYPDGEILTYGYDNGGQIYSVTGAHRGSTFNYVNQIGYDQFGQRVYIKYGNGVETKYTYDENRRWLSNINTTNQSGYVFQNMTYNFDSVGNILKIKNDVTKYNEQTFGYDDLYQLTSATGTYKDKTIEVLNKSNTYTQSFTYDNIGNMTKKVSSNTVMPGSSSPDALNYSFNYIYSTSKPHQATRIGDYDYSYDYNGNMTEKKRHVDTVDSKTTGSSTIKTTSTTNSSGGGMGSSSGTFGWGKQSGTSSTSTSTTTSTTTTSSSTDSQTTSYSWDEENRLTEVENGSNITSFLYNVGGERTVKYNLNNETMYVDKMYQIQASANPWLITKHIFVGDTRIVSKLSYESSDADANYEKDNTYYYHGDHLGSSNFITDKDGAQYEQYLFTPYGETWVEEQSDSLDKINFKFTSKELDEETGLYSFPQRYYEAQVSRWISPDPIYDGLKSGLSIYGYCSNNPLIYHDPSGLADEKKQDKAPWEIETSFAKQLREINEKIKADYNKKNSNYTVDDIVTDSTVSQSFENELERYELNDGTYLSYLHFGEDRTKGKEIKSPAFTKVLGIGEMSRHKYSLRLLVIGTNREIELEHLDESDLLKINVGQEYSPGEVIAPFPKTINFPAISGGRNPHVHAQEKVGGKIANPNTHIPSPAGTEYYYKKERLNADGTYTIIRNINLYTN